MGIVLGISFSLYCLLMAGATIIGLPGMWLMLVAALGMQFFDGSTFSWWTLGVAAALTIAGEIAEFLSGAAGAKAGGASRKAMAAAVVGGIVGAIVGTFVILIPIVGTLLGSAIGAGLAASSVELRTQGLEGAELRKRAVKVGAGAAAGRLVAVVIKGGIAVVLAIVLAVASFV